MNTNNDLDSSQYFKKFPLYQRISFNRDNVGDLEKLDKFNGNIDIYCPDFKKERTYNHFETYPLLFILVFKIEAQDTITTKEAKDFVGEYKY